MRLSEMRLVAHEKMPTASPGEVVEGGVYALLTSVLTATFMYVAIPMLAEVPAGGWVAGWPDPERTRLVLGITGQVMHVLLYANVLAALLALLYLLWTWGGMREVGEMVHWLVVPASVISGGSVFILAALFLAVLLMVFAALALLACLLFLPILLLLLLRG